MTLAALGELGTAVDAFETERLDLDERLVAASFPEAPRSELGELGHDVDVCVRYQLIPAASEALTAYALEAARMVGLGPEEFARYLRREEAVARLHGSRYHSVAGYKLRIAFKAAYFFLRAHQDMLFRVAFYALEGSFPSRGKTGTMGAAVTNPDSPVGRHLAAHVPAYAEWFMRWRDQRNRVKKGVSFSTFATDDIGICFSTFTNEGGVLGDPTNRLGLRDVAGALTLVTQVMQSIPTAAQTAAQERETA